ncbi:MAG: macro domain-containing protein, partial [Anaerolineae bacterium]|nr:macro domain-containing protein [Anaerolineae bacterium]
LLFVRGDLFASRAKTLVNTVNCVGVMGKGVALAFKERYPNMYEEYRRQCEQGEIRPGVLRLYKDTHPWVLNFPTKRHWRARSRLEDIEAGLRALAGSYRSWEITSLAMPALGCGHGGLDWSDVRPLIERYLGDLDIAIEVYEPGSQASLPDEIQSEEYHQPNLFGEQVEPPKPKRKSRQKKGARRKSSRK